MKLIIQLFFFFFLSVSSFAQGIAFHSNPDWNEMLSLSKSQNKIIFVDCYTSWCGPCQGLAKNIFTQKEVGDIYNENFINVKYDVEKGTGVDFKKKYSKDIVAFPTLLFIDGNTGEVVHKFVGAKPVKGIVNEANICLQGRGLSSLQKQYEAGERSFDFMSKYLMLLSNASRRNNVLPVIDEYITTYDDFENLKNPDKWAFYSNFIGDVNLRFVQYIINNKHVFDRLSFVDKDKLNDDLFKCLRGAVNDLIKITYNETSKKYEAVNYTQEKNKLIRDNIKRLNKSELNALYPRLVIFEYIINDNWEQAYYAINSAVDFQIKEIDYLYPVLCCFLAQESNDKKLRSRVYEDLVSYQASGEQKMQHFNVYDRIAFVASLLGEKNNESDALINYNRIKEARENMKKGTRKGA